MRGTASINTWPIYYGAHWIQAKDSRQVDEHTCVVSKALHESGMTSLFRVGMQYFSGPTGPADVKAATGELFHRFEAHVRQHTLLPGMPIEVSWATDDGGPGIPYRCKVCAKETDTTFVVTCDADGKAYTISTVLDEIRLSSEFDGFDMELLLVGMTDSVGGTYIGSFTWDGKLHDNNAVFIGKGKTPIACKYVNGNRVPRTDS